MPCTKCRADFNIFNWKIKCGECDGKYCNRCLKRSEGILYCETCLILIKRPPDRGKLMELKSKVLQGYLNKRNISTHGLVGNLESVITNETQPTASSRTPPRPPGVPKQRAPQPPSDAPTFPQPPFNQRPSPSEATTSASSPEPSTTFTPNKEDQKTEGPTTSKYPKLDDFGSAEELQNLSSKDLKILLTLNRVDFKGCVERSELLQRAERLWDDNNELNKEPADNLPVQDLCKLCMDAPLDCVLLECGHIATCIECGKKLSECPICRQYVVRVVRTFKA
ncbi:hypothetical protein NQ317_013569 [Molorchus minor]|uniref:RING-type domain-containing protein n=1 Tax=Molorchus minor TaxID=1323400 RepID=A0ABQ9JJH3_9CUCU|nr:hypothetical protein NQ317_013569 [Molorchus minor]